MATRQTPASRKRQLKQEKKAAKAAARQTRKEEKKARRQGGLKRSIGSLAGALGGADMWVAAMVILFSMFGVAMVFSAGYYQTISWSDPDPLYFLKRQLFFVVTGWLLLFIFANFDYHRYMKVYYLALAASVAMLVLVMIVGDSAGGAQRWIEFGPIRITPSEFSKVLVIVFTACFLVKDPDNVRTVKGLFVLAAVMAAHFILIVRQPNLSTAIVIVMIIFAIMLVAGLNMLFMVLPLAAAVGGYFYIITYKTPYHWYQRLTSFIDPFADRQGDGYQVVQGLIALGNGGLKGLGFGKSISKNMYLPEPQNDFILAIFGEELGFIGFLVLMACYMVLIFRLMLVALRARDRLGFYLATGVAVMLGLQVIINVAVVTSSMPATGITLPFISYGGSSMWSFMIAMGIALNVSKRREAAAAGRSARRRKEAGYADAAAGRMVSQ